MSKMKVYPDTSVISALFDERTPERQNLTKVAWGILDNYDVYISELVVNELSAAPSRLTEEFQRIIVGFSVLKVTEEAESLAKEYIKQGIFPDKYFDDALHIAIASVH